MRENLNKRIFLCYASEDKEEFVNKLAFELKNIGLDVWFDEYEICPGMSIRDKIDKGIRFCDIGIIVLSHDFFRKSWTAWELNGLVQKMVNGATILLPIYYKITASDVMQYSPSLADICAIKDFEEVTEIAKKIYETIYPQKPILITTRELLELQEVKTPDFYDNWWIERIEFSSRMDMNFIPWALPNNPICTKKEFKAFQLSWACMRYGWIQEAQYRKINQFTDPEEVYSFICNTPGVKEACQNNLEFVALYAPQLFFFKCDLREDLFEEYQKTKIELQGNKSICSITNDGNAPSCGRVFALMDEQFGNYTAESILRHFIEGEQLGPSPSTLDYWEILIRLCDCNEEIYPEKIRDCLLVGFKSNYAGIQLKQIFIKKEPDFLEMVFNDLNMLEQVIDEIISDRFMETKKSKRELAKKICELKMQKSYFEDKTFRITVPNEELRNGFRGITVQENK